MKGRAVPKVLFAFGREDDLDRDAVKRLVANRAMAPSSKLAAVDWFNHDVHVEGTYFKLEEADEPLARDDRGRRLPAADDTPAEADGHGDIPYQAGFLTFGESKDSCACRPVFGWPCC
ncbi:hypothetical protein ACFWG7_21440 [Streptomyces koyangensis]|uniref:hypothetical protein n=1 Tax=Streptomyces koyangensis TaxID=188770 RepID=UPI00365FFD2B